MKFLLEQNILQSVKILSELTKGTIVRRINKTKDQQGVFLGLDDTGSIILVNVINMRKVSFETEAGILRPEPGDILYRYTTSFGKNSVSAKAREALKSWTLYLKHPDYQKAMTAFMETGYAPEQILDFVKTDNLKYLFIPLQQHFKIGKFQEKIDWNLERKQRFGRLLEDLRKDEHITYIAFIPQQISGSPLFYSLGTKPHESTAMSLQNEPFSFKPNRGGHIKCSDDSAEVKIFIVDAGSQFIGKGHKTPLRNAEEVTKALSTDYKEYKYMPVKGREALSGEQSY